MSIISTNSVRDKQATLGAKFILVAALTLFAQIPLWMVESVVQERQDRSLGVAEDIAQGWGGDQSIRGPYLIVPYVVTQRVETKGRVTNHRIVKHLVLAPESLTIETELRTETRQRSIYKTPVYLADIDITGHFTEPSDQLPNGEFGEILWKDAYLTAGIADPRGVQKAEMNWDGAGLTVLPGTKDKKNNVRGLHSQTTLTGAQGTKHDFKISLLLAGSRQIGFEPVGRNNSFSVKADWANPSFKGSFLPTRHAADEAGFSAEWHIQHLATGIPRSQASHANASFPQSNLSAEVHLFEPQNLYRQVDRATKYGLLFISLTFLTLFVFEASMGQRIHFVQYLLIGLGLTLFFLTLIAYAEHLGFGIAYLLSSAIVLGMTTAYTASVAKSWRNAGVLGTIQLVLFGTIYVLLNAEDFALMFGSVILVGALATTMYVTRHVSWYADTAEAPPAEPPADTNEGEA
jgi:inner membrane protein